jgi:hypothetical protein
MRKIIGLNEFEVFSFQFSVFSGSGRERYWPHLSGLSGLSGLSALTGGGGGGGGGFNEYVDSSGNHYVDAAGNRYRSA